MTGLPEIIPIFPLPNFVLFPHVSVPLHIFEPRYREMVTEVAEDHRIIGMVMLKGEWERDYYANPDIYEIGCAGRISELVKLPDGRFNLLLDGLSEFRVMRESRERQYRQARIEWCPPPAEALELNSRKMAALRDLLASFLGDEALNVWRSLVEQRGLRDADLVNFLCFHLDVPPIEKQTLLEAGQARVGCLLDILTFKLEERKLGPGGLGGGSGRVQ